jgi:hypothetical protein
MNTRRGWGSPAFLALRVAAALLFVGLAVATLTDPSLSGPMPPWLRAAVALVEAVGGLSLLVPRAATYGAGVLGVVLLAAQAARGTDLDLAHTLASLTLLAVAALVAYQDRRFAADGARLRAFDAFAERELALPAPRARRLRRVRV